MYDHNILSEVLSLFSGILWGYTHILSIISHGYDIKYNISSDYRNLIWIIQILLKLNANKQIICSWLCHIMFNP